MYLQMSQAYMTEVLRVHSHFSKLIVDLFHNNKLFLSALDRACTAFVNYTEDNKPTKGPELVLLQYMMGFASAHPHIYSCSSYYLSSILPKV